MNRFDKLPGTDPTGDALRKMQEEQDAKLHADLSAHFAARSKKREAEARAREMELKLQQEEAKKRKPGGKIGWAAQLRAPWRP